MSPAYNLDSRTLTSKDGSAVFAEAIGDPFKPAVIFGHGMCGESAIFDVIFQREDLQQNIYAVRFDSRGHGRSAKPDTAAGYESARFAEDVQAIIDAFGLKNPFFAAWSLSGTIVADVCTAKIPLAGIIYLCALPYIGPIMGVVGTPVVLGFVPQLQSDDPAIATQCRIAFCRTLVAPARLTSVPQNDFISWVGAACKFSPLSCRLSLGRTQDPAALFEAGQRGLPLLMIGGKEDVQVRTDEVVKHMEPHFKVCESIILDGVGHLPFYEAPDVVMERILAFVAKYAHA